MCSAQSLELGRWLGGAGVGDEGTYRVLASASCGCLGLEWGEHNDSWGLVKEKNERGLFLEWKAHRVSTGDQYLGPCQGGSVSISITIAYRCYRVVVIVGRQPPPNP